MANTVLPAEARERVGKGAARALRRRGMIPAVIYGDKKDPVSIAVPYKEVDLAIKRGGFLTGILDIELDGGKTQVLPKSFQKDKVRDFPAHVDFLRVSARTIVQVEVPVHFINEDAAPGLTEEGGTLTVARQMVEINAPATSIPENVEVDLTGKALGDAIKSDEITLPRGVTFTIQDRDFAIASITATRAETEEVSNEPPEQPETEVINQDAETAGTADSE